MFENFDFKITSLFKNAERQMHELNHPYVGSEHLILAILDSKDKCVCILNKHGLTYKLFKDELLKIIGVGSKGTNLTLYTPLLKRVIDSAIEDAKENNQGLVLVNHLLLALLEESDGIAIRIMISLNIDLNKLYKDLSLKNNKETKILDDVGINLQNVKNERVFGREKEIRNLMQILLKKDKNNPLLIGKSGVGKTAIVEELAYLIKKKRVPKQLIDKSIISVSMASLVSGTKYRGEFEEKFTKVINECLNNEEIILFIDEIHTIINAGGAEGAIDASNILKPFLARGDLKVIGATTEEEYNKYIKKDKALARRFETIYVKEPTNEETINILMKVKRSYEKYHDLKISYSNIQDIINYADMYIYQKNNPDKSLEVLDAVCAKVNLDKSYNRNKLKLNNKLKNIIALKKEAVVNNDFKKGLILKKEEDKINKLLRKENNYFIRRKDIMEVIESKSNIPLLINRKEQYEKLKNGLYKDIIGHDKELEEILLAFKQSQYKRNHKPLSILLNGPTGVGKTFTVKKVAEYLNMNFIRLDMSEFNEGVSVNRLIGAVSGYVGYNDEHAFKSILYKPYSLILLDEIEKAHPKVLNLFLQILDEGYIKDNSNEKIVFNNTIIFMTSNALVSNTLGFSKSVMNNEYLSNELLGRIDKIVKFKSIDRESALKYIEKKNKLIDKEDILKKSNYQKYGFREINKYLKEEIQISS